MVKKNLSFILYLIFVNSEERQGANGDSPCKAQEDMQSLCSDTSETESFIKTSGLSKKNQILIQKRAF